MARLVVGRDISPVIAAATRWFDCCLIGDGSVLSAAQLWTPALLNEVHRAFVDHPDYRDDTFMSKLQGQMTDSSIGAKRLMAEIIWALLLFPSNVKASTKRHQIQTVWSWSGQPAPAGSPMMSDTVLAGLGSGGPGFNNYRPTELAFLISCVGNLKTKGSEERSYILHDYDAFMTWIDTVPQQGQRQFRHMLRFFAFPDRVERIASNKDRQAILASFHVTTRRESRDWTDRQLDDALFSLRVELTSQYPATALDFYQVPLQERWSRDRTVKTPEGVVAVTIPDDDDDDDDDDVPGMQQADHPARLAEPRQSIQMQAALAAIGATMGFRIWIPGSDRVRVCSLMPEKLRKAILEELPLNYDDVTLGTIEQIDVLWLKGRAMARAFEVEHTTAVYSGLLRMADLLALQPNMDIRLHIVAPEERKEKVFREMLRPVFALLDRGPLYKSCTFISYDAVDALWGVPHLAHVSDSIIAEYEEKAGSAS